MTAAWGLFLLLAAVIAGAGYWLSVFGDAIAERTGLSGSWIGLILMATVTSLPELATGVSAVRIENSPDLAVGDALGSCVFNLLMLALIDLGYRKAPLYARASEGHALSVGFGSVLLAAVALNLMAPRVGVPGGISWASLVILPIYLIALRSIFTYERRRMMEPSERSSHRPGMTLPAATAGYVLCAIAVVGAGIMLPGAAVRLAEQMGWGATLVGTVFLAAATSLPELVVTLSALRLGAVDMAIANLLGSNLFNMLVLVVDDMAYSQGPLLEAAPDGHAATALIALMMNGAVVAGLIFKSDRRGLGAVSWTSAALAGAYGLNLWLLLANPQG